MKRLRIKEVRDTRNKACGNYGWQDNEYLITIAEKRYEGPGDYLEVMLHEYLHFIFTQMRTKFGTKLTNLQEHRLIGNIEEVVWQKIANRCFKI
jgi:hypothetical protein